MNENEVCPTCKCCDQVWTRCNECDGGEDFRSACIDDMCYGNEECLHGDPTPLPCDLCEGKDGWWSCAGFCCKHGKHEQGPGCTESCQSVRSSLTEDYP